MSTADGQSILVVDDSHIVLSAVEESLSLAGFRVTTCDNPIMVAWRLRKLQPQLMLLDVDMPAVKGYEVVDALRKSDCLGDTRVILYSATTVAGKLDELARQCGAVGSLPKTVRGTELAERLLDFLKTAPRGTSCFSGTRALVIATPSTEATLARLLGRLGIDSDVRGVIGVDRALREGGRRFVVLEAAAFGSSLEKVLERVTKRALLDDVALVVIRETPLEGRVCLPPNRFCRGDLLRALKRAAETSVGPPA